MNKIIAILFLLISSNCIAQQRLKDTLRIAILSDSHGVGAYANPREDSCARGIFINYLKQFYPVVLQYNLSRSGATTFTARNYGFNWLPYAPDGGYGAYANGDTNYNMRKALSFKPDIILVFYTGNCVAFDFKLEGIRNNYKWFNDTAAKEKIKIYYTTGTARNSTFFSEQRYRDSTQAIRTWLDATYPGRVINILDSMIRHDTSGHGILPPLEWLSFDNLHYNNAGHNQLGKLLVDNEVTDGIAFNYNSYCRNIKFKKQGDSVRVTAKLLASKLIISGATTINGTYTELKRMRKLYVTNFDTKITSIYPFIKIQLYSNGKKTITYTKEII